MEFMGLSLIATGAIIFVISLLNSRHAPGSKSMAKIHEGLSGEQISKLSGLRPFRADARLGIYFGLFFIAVGIIRVAIVKWLWWGI